MSHTSGGAVGTNALPPPPPRPPLPSPSPSLRRWNTQLQTQILAKCSKQEQAPGDPSAAAASPSPIAASSAGAYAVPVAAASGSAIAALPSAAALTAVSHSATFLHLIHAIQSTHPQRRNHSATTATTQQQQQSQAQLPISTAATFFPLHSGLPTLLAMLQQRTSCTGNLYRTWSAGANAASTSATASSTQRSPAAASSRSRVTALQSTPRFSDDLLLARLVSRPSAAHASRVKAEGGLLYLEDQSTCVPAIVVGADVNLLGRWCLFPIWTLLIVPPPAASARAHAAATAAPQGVFEIQAQDAIPIPAFTLPQAPPAPQVTPTPSTSSSTPKLDPATSSSSLAWPAFAHPPSIVQAAQCQPLAFREAARIFDRKETNDATSAATSIPAAAVTNETPAPAFPAPAVAPIVLKQEPDWEERKMSDVPPSDAASANCPAPFGVASAACFSTSFAPAPSLPPTLPAAARTRRPPRPPRIPLRPPPAMIDEDEDEIGECEERKEGPCMDSMDASIMTARDAVGLTAVSLSLTPIATPRPMHAGKRKSSHDLQQQQQQPPPQLNPSVSMEPAPPTPAAVLRSTPPAPAAPAAPAAAASALHVAVKRQKLHASMPAAGAAAAVVAPATKRPPSVFHLRGTIQAISPIIQRDAAMFFFIDLRELTADAGSDAAASPSPTVPAPLSTVLLFTGASAVRWYSFLHVGCSYLFTRLRVSSVLRDAAGRGRMVCANTFAVQQQQQQQQEEECPFESRSKQTLIFPIKNEPTPKALVPPESPSPDVTKTEATPPAARSRPTSPPPSTAGSLSMPFLISTPASSASTPAAVAAAAAIPAVRAAPRPSPAPLPSTLSYTGTITSIPTWGVFDLDGDDASGSSSGGGGGQRCFVHPLCFVSSAGGGGASLMLRLGVGLRVGARVTLHHVHPLLQGRKQLGFLCCFASQIELLALAPSDRLADPFDAQRASWYASLWQRYAARDVALMLTLFLEARRKLGAIISSRKMLEASSATAASAAATLSSEPGAASGSGGGGWILRLLSPLLSARAGCPMDESQLKQASTEMYEQFFKHAEGSSCLMDGSAESTSLFLRQQRALPFPVLLPLDDLLRLRAVRRFAEQLAPKLVQPSSSSPSSPAAPVRVRAPVHEDWSYRFVHSRVIAEQHPQLVLAGVLQSSLAAPRTLGSTAEAGSLNATAPSSSPVLRCAMQLCDRSGSIDCVVLGDLLPAHVNAVLHICSFAIVMELSPATATAGTDAASALVSVLLFDIKDAVILQPAASAAPSVPVPRSAAASSAASSTSSRWFFLLHKFDSIVKPSLTAATPAASAAAKSSHQPKLSAASFQPTLHTQVEVLIRDGAESAASFRSATLRVEGAVAHQLFSFLPLHRAVHIEGVETIRSEPWLDHPPCFSLAASSRLLSVQPLPWSLQVRLLDVRDVLLCPVPRSAVPPAAATGVEIDRVTFRGIVLEKQFREANSSNGSASTSGPSLRRWWLNVRDVSELHTLSVYIDVSSRCFPAALVPGSLVSFHRLSRMLSTRFTIYAETTADSFLSVEACVALEAGGAMMHQEGEEPGTEGGRHALRVALHTHYPVRALPDTLLSSLSPFAPFLSMRTLSLRVRVVLLKKLVLRWSCGGCGRALLPGAGRCVARPSSVLGGGLIPACLPSPGSSPVCFLESTCVVDDGSAVALLFVEGDTVWDLLGLTPRRRAQLEEISRERGVLEYFHMSRAAVAAAQAEDSGGGAASASTASASSSFFVSQSSLRRLQLSLWDRHFRESYPGRQISLKAHQFFMRNVILQSVARRNKGEKLSAAATGNTATAGAAAASPLSPSAAAASSSSSIPFDACHTRKIIVGPKLQLPTLQAPPLTLRAVAIEPVNCRAEASKLLWMLKNGAS